MSADEFNDSVRVSLLHSGSETDPPVLPTPPLTHRHNPMGESAPPLALTAHRSSKGDSSSQQEQQRHRHPESELSPAWGKAGRGGSEERPLLFTESGVAVIAGNCGEGDDDDDEDDDVDEGNFMKVLSPDCSVVVPGDVRNHALLCDDDVASARNDGKLKSDVDVRTRTGGAAAREPHRRDVGMRDDVKKKTDRQHDDAPGRPCDGENSVYRRQRGSTGSQLSSGDVRTDREDDVMAAPTSAKRPGSPVRSFTSDCLRALGEEGGMRRVEVGDGGEGKGGVAKDQRHHHGTKAVRRLSSGDVPYCFLISPEGSWDIHNMTLIVPAPSETEENYLIGRANPRGDVALVRMTRLTEVAPTNSSIVDDDEQWKMPLHLFTSKKQGSDIGQYKSKRIRSYYKAQDQLITAFEDISLKVNDDLLDTDVIKRQRKLATFFSKLTLAVNVALLVAKLVASVLSGSISIISSLVDSVVDMLSGAIMWWATRAVKTRDPYTYPQGRTKLEPVSIIILSVVMALASLQLVRESVEKVVTLAHDPTSLPRVQAPVFAIAASTVVVKLVLWIVCRRVRSSIVQALAMDHRNDVLSNSVAIVCGYLGSREFQEEVDLQGFIYVDPAGAILISLYIVINWWQTGSEQIKMLTGHTARPDFLSKLTWTAMNHDPNVRHIDTVRAFHFGNNFLVELDIVLPEDMSLRVAHDIGESLQQKLENIPEVERAFVHLDYEYSHNPNSEHKVV